MYIVNTDEFVLGSICEESMQNERRGLGKGRKAPYGREAEGAV